MTEKMRRYVLVPITSSFLLEMFTEGWTTGGDIINCTKGLPADAEFVRDWYDPVCAHAYLVFYHPSFPEVDETALPEYFVPEFQRVIKLTRLESQHE